MWHPKRFRFGLLAAAALLSVPAAASAEPLPTMDEMRQMLKDEKYKELSPLVARALTLRGTDAENYSRHDLYDLKAEASLHTRAKQAAVEAFLAAAKSTDNADDAAVDRGNAAVVRAASAGLKFTAKKVAKDDKPEPLDVVDADSRKKALAALAREMVAARKTKVDAAVKADNLDQITAAAKDLPDLRDVEMAATGAQSDSKKMMSDLGDASAKLMSGALEKMATNLQDELEAFQAQSGGGAAKPGVSQKSVSIGTLKSDAKTVNANAKAVEAEAKTLSALFGDAVDLKPVTRQASELTAKTDDLLKRIKSSGG